MEKNEVWENIKKYAKVFFQGVGLFFAYNWLFKWLGSQLISISLVPATYILTTLSWEFMLGGIVVGGIASIIALRKFLVV